MPKHSSKAKRRRASDCAVHNKDTAPQFRGFVTTEVEGGARNPGRPQAPRQPLQPHLRQPLGVRPLRPGTPARPRPHLPAETARTAVSVRPTATSGSEPGVPPLVLDLCAEAVGNRSFVRLPLAGRMSRHRFLTLAWSGGGL
jgi:hypothetical protein